MYIEQKRQEDPFWIIRLRDEEKEEYIENISYAINECVEEESREELNKIIVSVFKNAQHNEQYDKDNEQSIIIPSSQITSLLAYLFVLLSITADSKRYSENYIDHLMDTLTEIQKRLNEIQKELMESTE